MPLAYQWHCLPKISDAIEVGNLFNEYFSSIADNFDVSLQNNSGNAQEPIATFQANCSIPLITIDDISNPTAILDQKQATGLDGIPVYFIKSSIHSIAPIILRICKIYSQPKLDQKQATGLDGIPVDTCMVFL